MALTLMTQSELLQELVDRTGWSRADAKRFITELDDIVAENAHNCVRTKIAGVVIAPALRKATKKRKGRNPATGEEVTISAKPASVKIKAKVVKPLSDAAPSVKRLQNAL